MKIVAIIPSRYGSTRLPGKPLLDIGGKPLIQWVYEKAQKARRVSKVIVATDDRRVIEAVEGFGGKALLTSPSHRTGTDRVAEAARSIKADLVVNIQGDEPLIDPRTIDQTIEPLARDRQIPMGTAARQLDSAEELADPNVVKVVIDQKGFALYFSRSQIPSLRDMSLPADIGPYFLKHVGLYVYQWEFLQKFTLMEQTPLEILEDLEQLRALENGFRIAVVVTRFPFHTDRCTNPTPTIGVDTPEDLEKVRKIVGEGQR